MNWFWYSLICVFGWGCADLFYKIGSDETEKDTHLKITVWVGFVMGITAFLLFPLSESGLTLSTVPQKAAAYFPASLGYIVSMVIGYAGLRYLELSIVSPVQNASGALTVAAMSVYYLLRGMPWKVTDTFGIRDIAGTLLIIAGTVGLAVVQQRQDNREEQEIQTAQTTDRRYTSGALALLFPILYCVFDTLGTAADGIILDSDTGYGLGEIDVLILYGLTFLLAGIVCFLILWFREKKPYRMFSKKQLPKAAAAVCEEFGQVFYVYAMAEKPLLAAPMVASYCILSVILSGVILKEKLKRGQMICVAAVIAGIVLLGISEGMTD